VGEVEQCIRDLGGSGRPGSGFERELTTCWRCGKKVGIRGVCSA
jgi:hypothetical protein